MVPQAGIVNETVDVAGPAGRVAGQERTREDWVEVASDEALRFVEEFVDWTQENHGEVRVYYTRQSHIGVRRGRRAWTPLWLRTDGAMVYFPDPDGSREEHRSVAFDQFEERLRSVGLEPRLQRTYNAGANLIAVRLRRSDLAAEPVQELLRASFEIFETGATPSSERQTAVSLTADERPESESASQEPAAAE